MCVRLQNTSTVSLLARLESIMGPIPMHMLKQGRYSSRFYTRERKLYNRAEKEEGDDDDESSYLLQPKRTTLADQVPEVCPLLPGLRYRDLTGGRSVAWFTSRTHEWCPLCC